MSTDKETLEWYNNNAAVYTNHVRDPKQSYYHGYYEKPAMYDLVPKLKNKTVLSLGCGSGEDSNHLKKLGARSSMGIDLSRSLINIAKQSYTNCEFRVMNMEKLNFPKASFDFVYSSLAIHYLKDWSKVFEGVYKVLKPKSYFLFSCAHPVRTAMVMIDNTDEKQVRRLEIIKFKQPKRLAITGDYLNRRKLVDGLGTLAMVTTWHKVIGEIIGEANQAGFVVEKFVEPRPLEAMKKISKRDYEKLNKIPEFMIFKLLKLK